MKTSFEALNLGEKFTVGKYFGSEQNIKITPSRVMDDEKYKLFGMFNAISLEDGRPRYFFDSEKVYKVE